MFGHARARVAVFLSATVVVLFLTTGVAQALMVKLPLARVTRLSRTVVVGDVVSVRTQRLAPVGPGDRGGIETLVRLRVAKALKGIPPRTVTVHVPGGRVGDETLVVEDAPAFGVGERCIVFLDRKNGVVGWRQGVLPVVEGVVVDLERPLPAVEKGVRAAANGASPAVLEPATERVRPARVAPVLPKLLSANGGRAGGGDSTEAHSSPISDGFEGSWTWSTSGSPTWNITDYRNNGGTHSAYCVQSTTAAPGPYPNSMNAWMYKTVNLSDATIAVLDFDVWFVMGSGDGWFCLLSTDGTNWGQVGGYTGSSGGWWHWSIDLRNAAAAGGGTRNYCGQSTVYVAFVAQSNTAGTNTEGAYMDNVTLWKDTVAMPSITSMTPTSGSAGTGTHVTIAGTGFGATQGTGSVEFYYNGSKTITAPITSWSNTSIDCTIPTGLVDGYPASAGSGPVKVIDNNGNWNAPYSYTVTFAYGGVQWASPGLTYRYNANCGDIANEIALVDSAVATWFPWSAFTFTKGTTCTTSTYPLGSTDGNNDIYWAASGFAAGVLAVNQYWYSGSTVVESDIAFNDAFTWCDGAVSGQYDVQTVATHETGHSFNLRDLYGPGDTSDVMYGQTASNSTKRSLSADDQAGVLWVYGPAFSGTMSINGGAAYTGSTAVTLNSSVTASQMHFRDQGGSYGGWEAYGATKSWTLPAGDGAKTVEGQYQNGSGKYFSTSDAITLDQTAPSTGNDATSNWYYSYTLHLTPSDAGSGVQQTYYRIDGGSWKTGTSAMLSCWKRAGYTGTHTVEYYSTDTVNNTESTKSCTVKLDGVPPVTTSDAPTSPVASPRTVHFIANDARSGVASTWYSLDGALPFVQGTQVTVTGVGAHTVQWYSIDNAGNAETREHRATFTLL